MEQIGIQANSTSKVGFEQIARFQREKRMQKTNYMPFLSKEKRASLVTNKSVPAPGQYELKSLFNKQTERDILAEKFNIVMANSKKIKESVFFKSSANRFNYKSNEGKSLGTSLNKSFSSNRSQKVSQTANREKKNLEKTHTLQKFKQIYRGSKQHYPSIPDKTGKFGYVYKNGKPTSKIQKDESQIEKQKNNLKNYVRRLNHERQYHQTSYSSLKIKQKEQKFKQQQTQKLKLKSLGVKDDSKTTSSLSETKRLKKTNNIILKQTAQCNISKVHKNIMEKYKIQSSLGPGKYELPDGFEQLTKKEKFQFFNSTEMRFKYYPKESADMDDEIDYYPPKNICKSLNNRNTMHSPIKQTKYFKRRKAIEKNNFAPGPGDYNPQINIIRKTLKTRGKFEKSPRFKDLEGLYEGNKENFRLFDDEKRNTNVNFRMMKRKTGMEKIKELVPSFHEKTNEDAQNETFLAPLGRADKKQNSVNVKDRNIKKLKMKKYYKNEEIMSKSKDLQEFSICSWEQRPQSRIELTHINEKKNILL